MTLGFVRTNLNRARTLALHAGEFLRPGGPPGIVVSHHKCGSVWTWNVIRSACRRHGVPARRVHTHQRRGAILQRACRVVMIIDSDDNMPLEHLRSCRLVHVTRDPRGILASMLESHRSTHPLSRREHDPWGEIARNRAALQMRDDDDGYRWLFENSDYLARVIAQMVMIEETARPADRIDLHDIATDPRESIRRLVVPLGIPETEVDDLAAEFAFSKTRDRRGHHRRGEPASWREELPADVIRSFQNRWGNELERLGYPACDRAARDGTDIPG